MAAQIPRILAEQNFIEELIESDEEPEEEEFAIPILIFMLLGEREHTPKNVQFFDNLLDLSAENFRYHCRLNRETFDLLVEEVEPQLMDGAAAHGGFEDIPIQKQIMIFIWYISNQTSMRHIAWDFGVAKSTVFDIVHNISEILASSSYKYIQWPNEQRRQEIEASFTRGNNSVPGVIGVIDGTHIRIQNPTQDRSYVNRKGYYSVQLQLVVDDTLLINDAFVGYPGSCHDSRVFRNSPLFTKAENGTLCAEDQHILGDSAYPVKPYLIPPFRNNGNLTRDQRHFNYCLSSKRQTVERAIGHLKGRFRKLRDIPFSDQTGEREILMKRICNFVLAGCVLHNMCILAHDDLEQFIDLNLLEEEPPVQQHQGVDQQNGNQKRNNLMRLVLQD